MADYFGLIQQGCFFGLIIVLATATTSAVAYPLLKTTLLKFNAQTQAILVSWFCFLPLGVTAIVLLSALLPSILQLWGLSSDHCLGHVEGHLHFCLVHLPPLLASWSLSLLAATFIALLGSMAIQFCNDLFKAWRFRRTLARYHTVSSRGPLKILDTAIPLAFSCGLARQEIYLSTGLLEKMSLQERLIVIAHEKSHLQRRDSLLQLLARTLALAHFPYIRKALLAHLHVACEQACDETAARETGDPGKVAELLLKIEKLYHGHFVTKDSLVLGLLGNSTSTLPGRISALLAPVGVARQPANLKLTALVFMLVLLVGHDLLHTALEHAFTLFTGI